MFIKGSNHVGSGHAPTVQMLRFKSRTDKACPDRTYR